VRACYGLEPYRTSQAARPANDERALAFATLRRWLLLAMLGAALGAAPAGAQMAAEEQLLLLEVRQAQVAYREASERWLRSQRLAADGLISAEQSEGERTRHSGALVDYQRALLRLLDTLPHLGIVSATKYQDERGRKRVRLVLRNDTPRFSETEYAPLLAGDETDAAIGDFLRVREITNVFVALKDVGDALPGQSAFIGTPPQIVIGKPYEARIDRLASGADVRLDFELLKDVENVVVSIRKNSRAQELPIKLEYDAQRSAVTVNSAQVSQEANLGAQASYDLLIERGAGGNQTLRLAAVGLPPAVRAEFVDPQTQARLSLLTLLAGTTSQRLRLRLSMPEKADSSLPLDRPLAFHALLWDAERDIALPARLDDAAARALGAGWVRLEVLPRGLGEISVDAPTLFFEVKAGEKIEMPLTVRNIGTRRLDDIQFRFDLPPGWNASLEPDGFGALEPNREVVVHATVAPARGTGVGEFEVRLQTRCSTDSRPLQVEDKRMRVSVVRTANVAGTGLVVVLVLGILASIVAAGIKLTRR
jgi:hypothetical protein